jgi:hypothetical protein
VSFRNAVPALVVLLLALFPASAQAAPWEIRGYEPDDPVAGDLVTFHADREKGSGDSDSLVWDFGDGSPSVTGSDPTHPYAAGTYSVRLYLQADDGTRELQDSVEVTVEPPPNTPPSAAFTFSPPGPLVGEGVLFTGGSDPDGDPITRAWDFGDGTPVSSEAAPTHAYAAAGPYTVTLSVTDDRAGFDSTSQDLTVSPQPAGPPPAETPPSGGGAAAPADPVTGGRNSDPEPAPVRMKPFPVVRMAGLVLPGGALVKILSVRAPRGARTLVRCSGRGCPAPSMARTSATRVVRFHRFERWLRAGVTLELLVRKRGFIGKYTRFLIRAGKAPTRVDRCLMPGRGRPGRCA